MTESPTPRRFLGRPDSAPPGFVPASLAASFDTRRAPDRSGALWLVKAISGASLFLFLGVHLVAQHFLAPGGLRDYASVVAYLHQPAALFAEMGLVLAVVVHVATAMRSFLGELIHNQRALRFVDGAIVVTSVGIVAYAAWITYTIVSLPVA
jgi:succinate dehydrogenase hydrophobic anchor subunit